SGGTYRDRGAIEELVAGLRGHGIPADVVHVDPWWMRWRRYCDYRWDEESFPHPQEFIDGLHRQGLRLCLWEHPYISVESDLFDHGVARGYFALKPDGSPYVFDYGLSIAPRPDGAVRKAAEGDSWNARVAVIDLTNAEASGWFKDLHRPLLRMGVDVFKTDFGEDIPEDAVFSNGMTGRTMHNLYPLLYNEAVFGVTREENGAGIVWGRSGTAGSQRYPVCWSGDPAADFESLASTVRGGLSAGMSGIPFWSNDIGGYRGTPDPELYVRWAQFGLLCSHSRMHGDSPREPWHFGDEACRIVRDFVKLRYRLFPYLYSTAYEATGGMPVLRALPLVYPDDPNAYGKDFEFLVGPWILAAPIYRRGERTSAGSYRCTRKVYLPEGSWYDYWEGMRFEGPGTLDVDAPLERIPLYLKGGAILPMMEFAPRIPQERVDPLIVDLYPEGESRYAFREDEGTTEFRCVKEKDRIIVEWKGEMSRKIEVRIRGKKAGAWAAKEQQLTIVDGQ
ncbi:MAG TPA: TIM-barrel domain-containing protein, partial [Bacteroidota bacterium]